MRKNKPRLRFMAFVLSFLLLMNAVPGAAAAESWDNGLALTGVIEAFIPLEADVAEQVVLSGTAVSDLNLPDTLTAKVAFYLPFGEAGKPYESTAEPENLFGEGYAVIPETVFETDFLEYDGAYAYEPVFDTGWAEPPYEETPGYLLKPEPELYYTAEVPVPVGWHSPDYDAESAGTYGFYAVIDSEYALGAEPPVIYVTVLTPDENMLALMQAMPYSADTERVIVPGGLAITQPTQYNWYGVIYDTPIPADGNGIIEYSFTYTPMTASANSTSTIHFTVVPAGYRMDNPAGNANLNLTNLNNVAPFRIDFISQYAGYGYSWQPSDYRMTFYRGRTPNAGADVTTNPVYWTLNELYEITLKINVNNNTITYDVYNKGIRVGGITNPEPLRNNANITLRSFSEGIGGVFIRTQSASSSFAAYFDFPDRYEGVRRQEPIEIKNGWLNENGWYYYVNDVTYKGWLDDGGYWYYLDPVNGRMQTGWLDYGPNWFYLYPGSGVMATGIITIGGVQHEFAGSGVWLGPYTARNGWVSEGGKWYFYENGAKKTGWLLDSRVWYYLNPDGSMYEGWLHLSPNWYYLYPGSGSMVTGIVSIGPEQHEFTGTGEWVGYYTAKNGWINEGGKWYFYENNVKKTGWLWDGNNDYYLDADGSMHEGWLELDSGTFYLFPVSGAMAKGGIFVIAGQKEEFAENGMWLRTVTDGNGTDPDDGEFDGYIRIVSVNPFKVSDRVETQFTVMVEYQIPTKRTHESVEILGYYILVGLQDDPEFDWWSHKKESGYLALGSQGVISFTFSGAPVNWNNDDSIGAWLMVEIPDGEALSSGNYIGNYGGEFTVYAGLIFF